jgi:hypothetical protein
MCRCRSFLIGKRKRATAKSPGRTPSVNTSKFCNRIPLITDAKTDDWRGGSGPVSDFRACSNLRAQKQRLRSTTGARSSRLDRSLCWSIVVLP